MIGSALASIWWSTPVAERIRKPAWAGRLPRSAAVSGLLVAAAEHRARGLV